LCAWSPPIELADGLRTEIELQVERRHVVAAAQRTDHVTERVFVARAVFRALAVVVEPCHRFQMLRSFVFLAEGVVNVNVEHFGGATVFGRGEHLRDLVLTQGRAHSTRLPRADAQEVGHIRGIGRLYKLPLQRRKGLLVLAD